MSSELNTIELRLLQEELSVVKQIVDEYRITKRNLVYIKTEDLIDIQKDKSAGIGFVRQSNALERLRKKGFISDGDYSGALRGIEIKIINPRNLIAHYKNQYESIPSEGTGARIIYCTRTGKGKINGVPFKLNKRSYNRRILGYLVKHPNENISKQKIWNIAKKRGNFKDDTQYNNIELNDTIKKLRLALDQMNSKHLTTNKRVRLHAEVTLIK